MHISEGLLPAPLWLGGYGITALLTGWSLHLLQRLEKDPRRQLPKAALLTAAFFVASSLHLPFPPASLHLLLNGLLGVLLGALAYPAIVVGLFFQAVAFGHGGLTTLGINAAIMGIPALLAGGIFRAGRRPMGAGLAAFWAGAAGVGLAALLFYGVLMAALLGEGTVSTQAERLALGSLVMAHLPLAAVEGLFTRWVVRFLQRVQPDLLGEDAKR
ncbi:cobalt transporter CbiM [Synechococcus sp. H60.3]|uniref:cobalt transporter CbiM n=1 Tax=Synechococcus sp. H60.3 TaxID=2967124 RepID=UPI0039C3D666